MFWTLLLNTSKWDDFPESISFPSRLSDELRVLRSAFKFFVYHRTNIRAILRERAVPCLSSIKANIDGYVKTTRKLNACKTLHFIHKALNRTDQSFRRTIIKLWLYRSSDCNYSLLKMWDCIRMAVFRKLGRVWRVVQNRVESNKVI